MDKPQVKTRFGMPGTEGFAIKGMGNATITLAIQHGRREKKPVILEGFEIPKTDKNNIPLPEGGVHIVPINLRTQNKFHTVRK